MEPEPDWSAVEVEAAAGEVARVLHDDVVGVEQRRETPVDELRGPRHVAENQTQPELLEQHDKHLRIFF